MYSRLCIFAWVSLLLSKTASAHMIMASPVPYSVDKIDNSPLAAGDFPCKQKIGYTISTMNNMAVGEQQTLSFKGTAVHGGGSCQLAVTLDKEPTTSSTFKVIDSIEGACPGLDGTASTFNFSIPKSIPNGQSTFAWTWFSKLSGAPEMYMNCAPITVTGGASDNSAFDALPDMFVANIPEAQCTSPQNFDTKFPNPGSVVEIAASATLRDPTGASCGSASGNSSDSSSAASSATPAASSPAAVSSPVAASSSAGGVFAPSASSANGGASIPAASTTLLTTMLTVTASPSAALSTPAAPASSGTSSANGTACSPDGAVVCNGETQFGLCDHGQVVWQAVAAGTTCSNGVISRRHPRMRVESHKRHAHSNHN